MLWAQTNLENVHTGITTNSFAGPAVDECLRVIDELAMDLSSRVG